MTLKELYAKIDGSYDQAISVLRIEKLIDKYIRKFPNVGVVTNVIAAGETMDPTQLFETAHAMKGVCSNLGLVNLAAAASEIAEEYRPGKSRTMSDEAVKEKIAKISEMFDKATEGINEYINSVQ
jgi:HPt (histidine-containing phosphotransfer) domain-containing protein